MIDNNKSTRAIKMLLVENHDLTRVGIRVILGETRDVSFELLEAKSLEECQVHLSQAGSVDLVLIGSGLPESSDTAALTDMIAIAQGAPVALLSGETDPAIMREALELGASGFIPKSLPSPVFRAAIALIVAGGTYYPAEMVLNEGNARARLQPTADDLMHTIDPTRGHVMSEQMGSFSRRQRQVLDLILKGKSNKEIARQLGISLGTAKNYVATILRLRNASSRAQLLSSFVVPSTNGNGSRPRAQ